MNDKLFSLYYELHEKRGEDAEPLVLPDKFGEGGESLAEDILIGVFDGMAGAGCIKIENKDGTQMTNAYKASRLVREGVKAFYEDHKEDIRSVFDNRNKLDAVIEALVKKLLNDLGQYADENKLSSAVKVKSTLIKLLPTTMAVAVVKDKGDSIDILCLWAGDSRCYIMSPLDGLQQLTKDDLKISNDALQNTISDSPMSNYIHLPLSGDHEKPRFKINGKIYRDIKKPRIVFVATDGCFGYVKTPMAFEELILNGINDLAQEKANGFDGLGEKIKKALIGLPTADDCSLSGILFVDKSSVLEFSESCAERRSKVQKEYIEKTNEICTDQKEIDEPSQQLKKDREEIRLNEDDKIKKQSSTVSSGPIILVGKQYKVKPDNRFTGWLFTDIFPKKEKGKKYEPEFIEVEKPIADVQKNKEVEKPIADVQKNKEVEKPIADVQKNKEELIKINQEKIDIPENQENQLIESLWRSYKVGYELYSKEEN